MTENGLKHPSDICVQTLLNRIVPGSRLTNISDMAGSYPNFAHAIDFQAPDGKAEKVVSRRFNPEHGKMSCRTHLEYTMYTWLGRKKIPVLKPIYLDDLPEVLDIPGFSVSFIPGRS
jgi:hypothetical protein